jgi:hypothetical protein
VGIGDSGKVRRSSPLTRYRAVNPSLDSQSLLKHMKLTLHGLGWRIQRFLYKDIIFSKSTRFMRSVYSALRISVYADDSFLPAPSSKRYPNSTLPATPPSPPFLLELDVAMRCQRCHLIAVLGRRVRNHALLGGIEAQRQCTISTASTGLSWSDF